MTKKKKKSVKKLFVSIPDDISEWLDKYIKKTYHGIRGGKSMAVTVALELLREQEKKK